MTDTLAEKREKKQEQLLIFLSLRLGKHKRGGASCREGGDRSQKDACSHLALAALLGMAFIVQWRYKSGRVISEMEVDGAGYKCIQVIWVMEIKSLPQSKGAGATDPPAPGLVLKHRKRVELLPYKKSDQHAQVLWQEKNS